MNGHIRAASLRSGDARDEGAASAELATAPPRDSPAALPGRQLAEALHDEQYPAVVRFLLFNGATWTTAQDAAQDAFTQMCTPGLSIAYPKACWMATRGRLATVRQVRVHTWHRRQNARCARPSSVMGGPARERGPAVTPLAGWPGGLPRCTGACR